LDATAFVTCFYKSRSFVLDIESKRFFAKYRLVNAKDFQRVFKNTGCKSWDDCLTILARKNEFDYPRLGVTISKKNVPSSVDRNRLKRLIRESFRHHLETLSSLDVVVINRRGVALKTNQDIAAALHNHWLNLARRCENC
jgi:ribonuclease P protein component